MKKLKVTAQGPNLMNVQINGRKLSFINGRAERDLPAGNHVFQWFVKAAPGTKYNLSITAPPEAIFTYPGAVDGDGRDGGTVWIPIDAH